MASNVAWVFLVNCNGHTAGLTLSSYWDDAANAADKDPLSALHLRPQGNFFVELRYYFTIPVIFTKI